MFRDVTGTRRVYVTVPFRQIRENEVSKWQRVRHAQSSALHVLSNLVLHRAKIRIQLNKRTRYLKPFPTRREAIILNRSPPMQHLIKPKRLKIKHAIDAPRGMAAHAARALHGRGNTLLVLHCLVSCSSSA